MYTLKTIVLTASMLGAGMLPSVAFAAATTLLPIRIVVRLQQKPAQPPQPFADVGGFTVRRNQAEVKFASCPNASNDKGELTCMLACEAADANMRLQLFSPLKERAQIVAGLSPPGAYAVDVVKCQIASRLPVVVVYKGPQVLFSELAMAHPEVASAVADTSATGVRFKSLSESTGILQALAVNPAKRAAILQLSQVAALYQETGSPTLRGDLSGEVAQYVTGAKSIVLKAATADALGGNASKWVKVSPDEMEFGKSMKQLEAALGRKPILSAKEIELSSDMTMMKRKDAPSSVRIGPDGAGRMDFKSEPMRPTPSMGR